MSDKENEKKGKAKKRKYLNHIKVQKSKPLHMLIFVNKFIYLTSSVKPII